MNDLDLAKGVVTYKGWRWLPGALGIDQDGRPWRWFPYARVRESDHATRSHRDERAAGMFPDRTDPATLGCLLSLIRKAWGDQTICVVPDTTRGGVAFVLENYSQTLPLHITCREYVGALVAALKDAP